MDMLTKEDLRQIGVEVGRVIEDNILPAMDTMIGEKMAPLKSEIMDHVDKKVDDLRGDMTAGFRKLEGRTDALVAVLREKAIVTPRESACLDEMRMFPRPDDLRPRT